MQCPSFSLAQARNIVKKNRKILWIHRLDAKHLATTVKDFLEIPYLNSVERSIHIFIKLKIKKQIQRRFEPIALDLGR